MRLQDRTAVITGGAGSLGSAQTRLFVAEGARVVIVDRVVEDGEKLVAELGDRVSFIDADIVSPTGWDQIVERATSSFGGVDILVNNAGISSMAVEDTLELDYWDTMVDITMKAPFLGIRAVLPVMQAAGGGAIVNVCSIAALIAADVGHLSYTAAKAGLASMTRAVASRYGEFGIRANNVYPGAMPPMRLKGGPAGSSGARERVKSLTALGRIGEADDIAYATLYFASDESSYVTGADLVVDGGFVIR